MTKAVKLFTDGRIEIIDVPAQDSLLDWYYEQIGTDCIENVYPKGLTEPFMLVVDGEALLKEHPTINYQASWLYETHRHGHPICGTVLVMKRIWTDDGPDIGGMSDGEASEIQVLLKKRLPKAVSLVNEKLGSKVRA